MNRIILKIKLIDKTNVKLTLVYVDKKFLSSGGNDFKYFYVDKYDFMIYSYDTFTFTQNTLKLPSLENYKPCSSIDINFPSEDKLKGWLKSLYLTLQIWNNDCTEFKKCSDYESRPKTLILDEENWIL